MITIQSHLTNDLLISGEETKTIKDELKKFKAVWLKSKSSWKISQDYLDDLKDLLEEKEIQFSEEIKESPQKTKPKITLKQELYSIHGDTKEIKEILKEIGCSWSPLFKCWLCSEDQKKQLEQKGLLN